MTINGNTTLAQGLTLTIAGTNGTASTPITAHYSNTASLNFPSLNGSCSNLTITVTGGRAGDTTIATPQGNGVPSIVSGTTNWFAWVSANDTVTIRACETQGIAINPGAETWRADVWRH